MQIYCGLPHGFRSGERTVHIIRKAMGRTTPDLHPKRLVAGGQAAAIDSRLAIRGVAIGVAGRKRAEETLMDADCSKEELLAMLVDELRNPFAPLSAAAQLLKP